MIWAITIPVFLGTAAAVMLSFFVFCRRGQIQEALREQRTETRSTTPIGVELCGLDEPAFFEMTLTENVSRHGARVISKKSWQPQDRVFLRLKQCDERCARIAYCHVLRKDAFAIGLKFSSAVDWAKSRSGAQLSHHPYRK